MRTEISLGEMRERIARLIFGNDWIGGLTTDQYEMLQAHAPTARDILRSDGSTIRLDHAKRCSAGIADKLDRALGRRARMSAQYVAVDSWIQDHGLPVDPSRPADRKAFNALLRKEMSAARARPAEKQRGPKAQILPRLSAAMQHDLSSGALTRAELLALPDKELEARYGAKRERVRAARSAVLNGRKF
jgi:hypothetical protein